MTWVMKLLHCLYCTLLPWRLQRVHKNCTTTLRQTSLSQLKKRPQAFFKHICVTIDHNYAKREKSMPFPSSPYSSTAYATQTTSPWKPGGKWGDDMAFPVFRWKLHYKFNHEGVEQDFIRPQTEMRYTNVRLRRNPLGRILASRRESLWTWVYLWMWRPAWTRCQKLSAG